MDASNWVPLGTAAVGVIGTLLGSALTIFYTRSADKRRQEYENRTRYNTERLQTYTEFVAAVERLLSPRDHEERDADTRRDEFQSVYRRTRMLASPPVRLAAERLLGAVVQMRTAVYQLGSDGSQELLDSLWHRSAPESGATTDAAAAKSLREQLRDRQRITDGKDAEELARLEGKVRALEGAGGAWYRAQDAFYRAVQAELGIALSRW